MMFSPLECQVLHVLFSFAQADRRSDVRLAARLLMCSQRELRSCLDRLATLGMVEAGGYGITETGMVEAARMRQRRDVSDSHVDRAA
jgi:Mn-dependent DtxR family transcriptional regulator